MSTETILVPLDGSRTARRALPYAAALATMGERARVVLVTVLPTREAADIPFDIDTRDELDRIAKRRLRAAARRMRALGVEEIEIETAWGVQTDDEIIEAAERHRATMIVMGTHGRSGLARALLGSVAMSLTQHSPVPCVFVPPGTAIDRASIDRALLPVDGSELAEHAVPIAKKLAAAGTHVTALRVLAPSSTLLPFASGMEGYVPVSVMDDMRSAAEKYIEGIAGRIGHGATGEIALGAPAKAIVDIAHERNMDLIVMTTHARSTIGRIVLGSIADRVLRTAKMPVLVVHPSG